MSYSTPTPAPVIHMPKAVFFDVDFTLIYPGQTFDAGGYRRFAARHGLHADLARFETAVAAASVELDQTQGDIYRAEPFIRYARRVIREMGGDGPGLETCAREIYDEWAACQHFVLYDDVIEAFGELYEAGYQIGLISNTHRSLASFQSHFDLDRFITAAISSSEHGYLKPHPSIFRAAVQLVGVNAAEAVMVGDSLTHDIAGASQVGMHAVLLVRSGSAPAQVGGVPVIRTLHELPRVLEELDRP